jgi:ArsR family transcriptional regulator
MDSEILLDILGNDTRRRILSILAKEPMYFNQVAKKIGIGQQAVLRHMQALENSGLIETYSEKSDFGAPDRKYYRLNSSFVLTVALSEDNFKISSQKVVEFRYKDFVKYYRSLESISEDTGKALSSLQENLGRIEQEISTVESHLNDLLALRQLILQRLHKIGQRDFEEDERMILYSIIEKLPKSMSELSGMTDMEESAIRSKLMEMKSKISKDSAELLFGELG